MEGLFVNKVSTDLFVGDCSIVVAPHEVHLLVVFVEHVGTNLDELRICNVPFGIIKTHHGLNPTNEIFRVDLRSAGFEHSGKKNQVLNQT